MVLETCVMDLDFSPKKLMLGDVNGMFLYLRSTAYGDVIDYEHECDSCKKKTQNTLHLSSLEIKEDFEKEVSEDGYFYFTLPNMKIAGESVIVCFRPKTFGDELDIIQKNKDFKDKNPNFLGDKKITFTYESQIVSINSITQKEFIRNFIKKMPLGDSIKLREYMEKVEPGIKTNIVNTCSHCSFQQVNKIPIDYNILKLDGSYKNNSMDEMFMISYYGKGGYTRNDVFNMPITERRWVIQRMQEEVEKRNKAEQQAMKKS
jgi:hypothetical protein